MFISKVRSISVSRNIPPNVANELNDRLAKAGFIDIYEKVTDIPINHSGKVGQLLWEDYSHVYRNLRGVLAKIHPEWESVEAFEKVLQECGAESKESKICFKWHSLYCRKPEAESTQN